MKIEQIYEEIKQYEINTNTEKFKNKGDLYIQTNDQIFKHFLDRISYKLENNFILIYSPKLGKTFKIPDTNLKNLENLSDNVAQTLAYPTYLFGYEPMFVTNYNDEYIWNDKELSFYLEKIR